MTVLEMLREKREGILRIAAEHGARNVRVFGSVVRGESGPESDVDFLVEFERGRSLLDHAGLVIALGELVGCKVDVATEAGLRERIRGRVLGEAVPL